MPDPAQRPAGGRPTAADRLSPLRTSHLAAAFDERERFYNRHTRLVIVSGPRGPLLAHYLSPQTVPDARRHVFLTYYPDDYPVYEGTSAPRAVMADVTAFAVAVERDKDARLGIEPGLPTLDGAMPPSPDDVMIATGGRTLRDAMGLTVAPTHISAFVSGQGLRLSEDGFTLGARLTLTRPTHRGITQESPLFGILPKTAVTFFAADYVPSVRRLLRLAALLASARSAIRFAGELLNMLDELRRS